LQLHALASVLALMAGPMSCPLQAPECAAASSMCLLTMSGGSRGGRVAEALWGSWAALVAGRGARREALARRVCLLGRGNSVLMPAAPACICSEPNLANVTVSYTQDASGLLQSSIDSLIHSTCVLPYIQVHTVLRSSLCEILMFGDQLPTVRESIANQTGQVYANLGDYGQGVYCPQCERTEASAAASEQDIHATRTALTARDVCADRQTRGYWDRNLDNFQAPMPTTAHVCII